MTRVAGGELRVLQREDRVLRSGDRGVDPRQLGLAACLTEGRLGGFAGLPVYLDSRVPTNQGAGTNRDFILVVNTAESYLYGSQIRTRVLPEVAAGRSP